MPKNKAFHRRIQILDQCLRRRQKVWTVNSILEATNGHLADRGYPEISLRTLYEDLKYLQETLNAPVEKYQQGKMVCYRYSDPEYTLNTSPLSFAEKEILKKVLDFLRANDLPMQSEMAELLDKHGIFILGDLVKNQAQFNIKRKLSDSEIKMSKCEEPDLKFIQKSKKVMSMSSLPSEDYPLNKLILRMELAEFSAYRDSFWKWLESEA